MTRHTKKINARLSKKKYQYPSPKILSTGVTVQRNAGLHFPIPTSVRQLVIDEAYPPVRCDSSNRRKSSPEKYFGGPRINKYVKPIKPVPKKDPTNSGYRFISVKEDRTVTIQLHCH